MDLLKKSNRKQNQPTMIKLNKIFDYSFSPSMFSNKAFLFLLFYIHTLLYGYSQNTNKDSYFVVDTFTFYSVRDFEQAFVGEGAKQPTSLSLINFPLEDILIKGGCGSIKSLIIRWDSKTKCVLPDISKFKKQLSRLESVELDFYRLPEGFDVFLKFKQLTELSFACRSLRVLPKQIFELKLLRKLTIEETPFVVLPLEISHLKSLRELHISDCKISTLPGQLSYLSNLEKLYVISCPELRLIDGGALKLKKLSLLNLCGNENLPELPKDIFDLKCLKVIYLENVLFYSETKKEQLRSKLNGVKVL